MVIRKQADNDSGQLYDQLQHPHLSSKRLSMFRRMMKLRAHVRKSERTTLMVVCR